MTGPGCPPAPGRGPSSAAARQNRPATRLIAAAVLGQLVGLLGWFDALFIPLVLLGPVVTGAVAAARRVSYLVVAVLWCSVGINMAWTDWVVNHADVAFHLGLSVVIPLLAGVGYGVVWLAKRSRRVTAASPEPSTTPLP